MFMFVCQELFNFINISSEYPFPHLSSNINYILNWKISKEKSLWKTTVGPSKQITLSIFLECIGKLSEEPINLESKIS